MKCFLVLCLLATQCCFAQKIKKADKVIIASLKDHIGYLSNDQLEGRRTGSAGELLAANYIRHQFEQAGLAPKGDDGTYFQAFEVNDGKGINPSTHLIINDREWELNKDYFPLSFSSNGSLEAATSIDLREAGGPWFSDLGEMLESNKNNPHFDLKGAIQDLISNVVKKGAAACILYNSSANNDELAFEAKDKSPISKIPVIYLTKEGRKNWMKEENALLDVKLKVDISGRKRTGHNVVAYLDNKSATTVIIGAHYDHLGYGEDHNSLYSGTTPAIHNGADDNASGTAAVLEISKLIKASKLTKNNYLFITFSGEELGLYGSKYFTEHPTIDLSSANYMINMDMVGRLNDSTHGLTIGGYGTSPVWETLFAKEEKSFKIHFDSSGTGPSDHTSFYRKDLPVLFFFTGIHGDYHKPSDDADKINYTGEWQLIKFIYKQVEVLNNKGKLPFTKTKEAVTTAKSSFKVTLGIMPDYTFDGIGVRADGVSEGKIAQKAGIKTGDVIVQLGEYSFTDVQSYMETLAKFKKGDATTVKVKRGNETLSFNIVF